MRLRSIALALTLVCGFTAAVEAKNKPNTKHQRVKQKVRKQKVRKLKPGKAA
jgi:hypothetical protein